MKRLLVPSLKVVESKIYLIRGHKIMLDEDLAELYGVTTMALNQAVKRNKDRFPADFMFQINKLEYDLLRSQFVILKKTGRGQHRKYLPYAFTEQGVAMLSGALKSKRAIQVNVGIMRAFVQMREAMIAHKDLARKLNAMEKKYDHNFAVVFDAIRQLMEPPVQPKRKIGYIVPKEEE